MVLPLPILRRWQTADKEVRVKIAITQQQSLKNLRRTSGANATFWLNPKTIVGVACTRQVAYRQQCGEIVSVDL